MSSQVGESVSRLEVARFKRSARPFGLTMGEMATALFVLLFFLLVMVYYLTSLRPEQTRLEQLKRQEEQQKNVLIESLAGSATRVEAPKDAAREALDSLEVFKNERLRLAAPGQRLLIDEINALVKKHGLQLTSAIDSSFARPSLEEQEKASRSGSAKTALDVYPRLNLRFTVFGQYPKLRAFISELERSRQFLVLESINLKTEEAGQAEESRSRQSTGSGISLTINSSAYFQQ